MGTVGFFVRESELLELSFRVQGKFLLWALKRIEKGPPGYQKQGKHFMRETAYMSLPREESVHLYKYY